MPAQPRQLTALLTLQTELTHANLNLIVCEISLCLGCTRDVAVVKSDPHRAASLRDDIRKVLDIVQGCAGSCQRTSDLVDQNSRCESPSTCQHSLGARNGDVVAWRRGVTSGGIRFAPRTGRRTNDYHADIVVFVGCRPALLGKSKLQHIASVVLDDDQGPAK